MNTKQNKASGLFATKADIWVTLIKDFEHTVIFATTPTHLKTYIENNTPYKTFDRAGDKNAMILLYRAEEILTIFERLDVLEGIEIKKILKGLLKGK